MSYIAPVSFSALTGMIGILGMALLFVWISKKYTTRSRIIITVCIIVFGIATIGVICVPTRIVFTDDSVTITSAFIKTVIKNSEIERIELYSSASEVPYSFSIRKFGIGMPGYSVGSFQVKEFNTSFLMIQGNGPVFLIVSTDSRMHAITVSDGFLQEISQETEIPIR